MPVCGRGARPPEPPQIPGPWCGSRPAQSPARVTESRGIPGAGPCFLPGSGPAAARAGGCAAPERGLSPCRFPRKSRTSENAPRDLWAIFLSLIFLYFFFYFNFILNNKSKPRSHESATLLSVYGLKGKLKIPFFLPPFRLPRI